MTNLLPGPPKPTKQQQAKVLSIVSPKVKLMLVLMGLLLYVYILIFVKTLYLREERMDHTSVMAMETARMIRKIHAVDKKMAINMERLREAIGEY